MGIDCVDGVPAPRKLMLDTPLVIARKFVLKVADQADEALGARAQGRRCRSVVVGAARHLDHFAPPPDGAACGPLMIDDVSMASR